MEGGVIPRKEDVDFSLDFAGEKAHTALEGGPRSYESPVIRAQVL